jgi:pimeloyl-ACP methyl ester carboxylesterase
MKHSNHSTLLPLVLVAMLLGAGRTWLGPASASTQAAGPGEAAHGAAPLGETITVELCRGYQGYDGVNDTYLLNETTPAPHGAEQKLHIKEFGGGTTTKRTLVRFDLSLIPEDANVTAATLDLYLDYRYPDTAAGVNLYYLLKPWSEATATWVTTGLGQDWAIAGVGGVGTDRDGAPFASGSFRTVGAYNRIDVREAVRRWVRSPEANFGFMVMGTSSVDARVWSSEVPREGQLPRLIVTYEPPPGTPGPTRTPTATLTPTVGPSPTPTPANIIYSFGPHEAFTSDEEDFRKRNCIEAGPTAHNPDNTVVLLVWEGSPTFAKLTFGFAGNNNRHHSILVNDQVIGHIPGDNYSSVCTGGSPGALYFDPSVLMSGVNKVSIVADVPGELNSWSLQDIRIQLGGDVQGPIIRVERQIPSTWDHYPQRAIIQKPVGYAPGTPTPLVVALHGWGERDYDALLWLSKACNDRRWLLACSDTRGGSEHTASPAVQRDVIDLIDYMVNSPEFTVDTSRVYIVGNSMGGMMAATIAAKYPDRFAALADFRGPTRLDVWYDDVEPWRKDVIYSEINAYPATNPLAYQSRSAGYMAMNLRNVPTVIVHGRGDTLVDFQKHAQYLADQMTANGNAPLLVEYSGGHGDPAPPEWGAEGIMSFFSTHVLNTCPLTVTVHSSERRAYPDSLEPRKYYWLGISYDYADHWIAVNASFDRGTKTVTIDVLDEKYPALSINISLDLARMGLPAGVPYTVEDSNLDTGAFEQRVVTSSVSSLVLNVPGDHHRFVVYPMTAPAPQTVVLSQGEAGYTGTSDTFIEGYVTGANHGAETQMTLSNGGNRTPLLRFALDSVPAGIVVKGAQLSLYATYRWGSATSLDVSLHRVLRPWEASQATWFDALAGQKWSAPGALGPGQDYEPTPNAQREMRGYPVTYSYDVTGLVRQWLGEPQRNYGVLLRGSGGSCNYNLGASESAQSSARPRLIIKYTWPTATPTATNTFTPGPTPTASPTPTSTPSPTRQQQHIHLPVLLKGRTGG